jgi:UDP-N-acetylmuramyl pentapeptide phosphotransferase/UDP-N-acetylglucosamine-1-phosphate transferase
MKTIIKISIISFVFSLVFLLPMGVNADPPGMPGNHGSSGNQIPGGGAPLGSGVAILIGLGLAYGSKNNLKEIDGSVFTKKQ